MLTWISRPIAAFVPISLLAFVLSACGSGEPESSASSQEACLLGNDCAIGDVGPGGGLVFLISGGRTYEMAPKTWNGGTQDPYVEWCSDTDLDIVGASGVLDTAVGTGAANTKLIVEACESGAANVVLDYDGGEETDWFLPSKDELNAMCNYSLNPTSPAAPTVVCSGSQNETFESGTFGFVADGPYYWSSSQDGATYAWSQSFGDGYTFNANKYETLQVRPVRAF